MLSVEIPSNMGIRVIQPVSVKVSDTSGAVAKVNGKLSEPNP